MTARQLNLFRRHGRPVETVRSNLLTNVRRADPETSHQAAVVNLHAKRRMKDDVLAAILRHPSTVAEVQDQILEAWPGTQRGTVSRRISDLKDDGLVEASAERRQTSRGALGIVWRATRLAEFATVELARTAPGADGAGSVANRPRPPF